jgi:arylsulfatase A-like enzyme/Tfp pilus assembly protein PilF
MNLLTRASLLFAAAACLITAGACNRETPGAAPPVANRPSILLVTLDTTRADAVGPDAQGVETPAFNALVARGRRFRQAYATVAETLPSHASLLTGLYPAGHGIHENARYLQATQPLAAERLKAAGYRTAAFVSSFVLDKSFGLGRGFDVYDDALAAGTSERSAKDTTDRALEYLAQTTGGPQLIWVHYFDAHAPYAPPQPFAARYSAKPYLGEVAAADQQLARLVEAFERQAAGPSAIIVVADHGEGLGEHGESQHGTLLYQATMHVPLVIVGPGFAPGAIDTPVSTRRIFHTLLDLAGIPSAGSLRSSTDEVVLGEAMKPFLSYGWQPQIMAVGGRQKAIFAGVTEVYDIGSDPREARNLGSGANLPSGIRKALDDYPVPSVDAAKPPENLSDEARRAMLSLGYVSAGSAPVVRKDAPRPADMVHLLPLLESASALFVGRRYADVIPLLDKILEQDPHNLDAVLRLATAHSSLGHEKEALAAFRRATAIAPRSPDVRVYLALHYARGQEWRQAVPVLEQMAVETPDRRPVVETLARHRIRLGDEAMAAGDTGTAIAAFEASRRLDAASFSRDLELGVLYLAARRFEDARAALDRVPPSHSGYAMALFKRAQVSVLLNERDAAQRIQAAREGADATTRDLIERERLFRGR